MPNIVELLFRDYIKPYKRYILIFCLIIVFSIAGVYGYKWFAQSQQEGLDDDYVNENQRQQKAEVHFFNVDWCPHCTKAKPEWKAFKKNYDGKEVNGYLVNCIDANCTEESSENTALIQTYKIDSYPTIKMIKGGDIIDFDAKISSDSLGKFIETILTN